MNKIYRAVIVIVLALLCLGNGRTLEVRLAGDKLSVQAEQVSLRDILGRLAALGITIRIDPQVNPKISASFEDRDVQQGLASILKSIDHVLIWETIEGPLGPMPKLAEIQVFKPGKKGLMKRLGTGTVLNIGIDPKDGSLFVRDEMLLRLKQGVSLSQFKRLLKQIQGTVIDVNKALGIYRIRLPAGTGIPSIVEEIAKHPGIAEIQPNYAYPISLPNQDTALNASNQGLSSGSARANAAPIAVLDTGVGTNSALKGVVVASLDALNPGEPISDTIGHGTQMALIASGLIKPCGVRADSGDKSPIIAVRAFDDNGYTSDFGIMRSVEFALDNGARVMSLSWGSNTNSDFLERYMDYASAQGLVIVAAAGNEPTGEPINPAAYSTVIAVGALDPEGNTWKNSNYGDFVTLYAPGFAWLPVGSNGDPGVYSGTSISTAFVANLISQYFSQNPGATSKEIFDILGHHAATGPTKDRR